MTGSAILDLSDVHLSLSVTTLAQTKEIRASSPRGASMVEGAAELMRALRVPVGTHAETG